MRYLIDERTKQKSTSKELVYDVAFNPAVLDDCKQSPILDSALVTLILEYVESMNDLKVLDKTKCKKVRIIVLTLHVCVYMCSWLNVLSY